MLKHSFIIRCAVIFFTLLFIAIFITRGPACAAEYITLRTAENGEDIRKLFKVIAMQAGINILIDKSAAGKINAEFKDLYYKDALKNIAGQKKLFVIEEGNIFIISAKNITPDEVDGKNASIAAHDGNSIPGDLSKPEFDFISVCASGEDIRLVLQTLAVNAGKEILYDATTRGVVAFNLKNTDFESAVRAIATVNGLSIKKENGKYYIGTAANLTGNIDSKIFSTDYPGLGKKGLVQPPHSPSAVNAGAPPRPPAPPMPFKVTVTAGGARKKTALISLKPVSMIVSDDDDSGITGVIKVVEIKENSVKIIDCQSDKERILTMKR